MDARTERRTWEHRHRKAGAPGKPAQLLLELIDHLPRGCCLDIAAGRGGNPLFMAGAGYRVDAIDWSVEGLRLTRREALHRRLGVNLIAADLVNYPLARSSYDVVLCFGYLDRSLWPAMRKALKPNGALLFETVTLAYRQIRPDFPEPYCLEPGELMEAFPELQVAFYRELPNEYRASLLAFRRPGD